MESGDQEIAPVEKALRHNPPVPLIDVTRPHNLDVSFAAIKQNHTLTRRKFDARFEALRPGRVVDRHRWALRGEQLMSSRNYKDVSR